MSSHGRRKRHIVGVELNLQSMVMPILETAAAVDASRPAPLGLSSPQSGDTTAASAPIGHVNVAVFAPDLERMEMAYQAPGEGWRVHTLPNKADGIHFGIVDGVPPGTRYGFRAAPEGGGLPVSGAAQRRLARDETPRRGLRCGTRSSTRPMSAARRCCTRTSPSTYVEHMPAWPIP